MHSAGLPTADGPQVPPEPGEGFVDVTGMFYCCSAIAPAPRLGLWANGEVHCCKEIKSESS